MAGPWEKYQAAPAAAGDGPWAKYAAKGAPAAPAAPAEAQSDAVGAGVEGFGNGASLGYLPQLQAAAAKPIYAALNAITGQDVQPDSYVQERDTNIARQAELAKSNPYMYHGAQLAGGVATGIATSGLLPGPAATIGGRIAQAGAVGAGLGAIANPGDVQGVVDTSGQLGDRAWDAAKGGALGTVIGTAVEAPGIIRSGANAVKNAVANKLGKNVDFTPIADQQAVKDAASKIGITDVPKALLTDNPTFQKLESGLSQSGSIPAKGVRDQYTKLFKGLDDAAEKIDALKSPDSDFAIGSKIQKDLTDQVKKNVAPVAEMYNDLNPVLKKIAVDSPAVNTQFGALKRNPLFQTKDGIAMLEDQKEAINSIPELASLKEFRSTLHDSVGPNSTPLDQKRVDAIYDAVTKIRDNSINATKNTLPKDLHGEVDSFINQHALADAAHSTNLDDINSIKSLVGNKDFKSPTTFLNKLGEMKESDLAQKASNLDVGTWRNLQDKFPSVFEKAKSAKINDMVQRATNSVKGFNDTQFIKQWDGMDQELKDILFDPKMQEHINALQTVKQAIPDKLGPSGTPEGKMLMEMFNPKRNALDYGVKKTLDSASSPGSSAASAASAAEPSKLAVGAKFTTIERSVGPDQTRPAYGGSSRPAMDGGKAKSADDAPAKGADKWANDGFKVLKEHGRDPASSDELDSLKAKLLADPKGKQLLINASDLKPGSKALDKIMERIKRDYGNTAS